MIFLLLHASPKRIHNARSNKQRSRLMAAALGRVKQLLNLAPGEVLTVAASPASVVLPKGRFSRLRPFIVLSRVKPIAMPRKPA